MRNFKNEKGAALISITIAVAFVTILATALLSMSVGNYRMKVLNNSSKTNFYETEGELTVLTTNLRQDIMSASNPKSKIESLCTFDTTTLVKTPVNPTSYASDPTNYNEGFVETTTGTYNVDTLAKYANASATGSSSSASYKLNGDDIVVTSASSGMCRKIVSGTLTTYVFEDLVVKQVASHSEGNFSNAIKSDITYKINQSSSAKKHGGIGEFSMLMDAPLSVSSGKFTTLDIYGNTFLSNYLYDSTKKFYMPGTYATGTEALHLTGESKVNLIGDYLVVYGDIVLDDSSCLNISGNGTLCVYGDIYLNGNSLLICSGQLYMVDGEILPNTTRTAKCAIHVASGTLNDHVAPQNISINSLEGEKFSSFVTHLNLDGSKVDSTGAAIPAEKYGVTRQIYTKVTNAAGNEFDLTNYVCGNINGGECTTGEYYGKKCKVNFVDSTKAANFNGSTYDDSLVFLLTPTTIKDSNVHTTIISAKPVTFDEAHGVSLSKLGSDIFSYLTIKSSDTTNYLYDSDIHKITVKTEKKGDFVLSAGDLFDTNADEFVNVLLDKATGGTGGSAKYTSSLAFTEWEKDYE